MKYNYKYKEKTGRKKLFILFILFFTLIIDSYSEGTKEFRPNINVQGNLEINDRNRPFALESNTDSLHRLYFYISDISEKVFLGFNSNNNGTATFRIKSPDHIVVYPRTQIPSSGNGYINNYEEAIAGPITNFYSNGYNPISFNPNIIGDYYIEFTTSNQSTYHFDLFDLTVTDSINNPIKGRLWSYAWDLSTRSFSGMYDGDFFIYSNDGFVSKLSMNKIQPFGFVVSCNNSGPENIKGDAVNNRKSKAGNSINPQYKIFLNEPDSNIYPSGKTPEVIEELQLAAPAKYKDSVLFTLHMSIAGSAEIFIDLNGENGYQDNSEDVVIIQDIEARKDSIYWNGRNSFGEFVSDSSVTIFIFASYSSGITHFPVYDVEKHNNGFTVERIRPIAGEALLFWDDSNISPGAVELNGKSGPAHKLSKNFGNEKTINSWWTGHHIESLKSFSFSFEISLPIVMGEMNAFQDGSKINILWNTYSEINNEKFIVQKLCTQNYSDKNWCSIKTVFGAGNSNSIINYSTHDNDPYAGINYYRIKQIDFDGHYEYSKTVAINFIPKQNVNLWPNPLKENHSLHISYEENEKPSSCIIYDLNGNLIWTEHMDIEENEFVIESSFEKGTYLFVETYMDFKRSQLFIVR